MLASRYQWQVASRAPESLFASFPAQHPLVVQLLFYAKLKLLQVLCGNERALRLGYHVDQGLRL